ncbi:selenide, water dikinase SelD [Facklamia sp. 7083-14-GEN3]|uniref:selenide, water dikinase SelD n=1 Tax=Facklamia sp. 7083-14-GEN3 TaxID=2973478 RepID=UPI00215BC7FE|nr:selenide, water dikinase SelD [Facklamia sp. 7083-14-GEN3]MCR8968592.1 selenide, water dikinase SelD [Facklamia sp. 7083-14-GEN3]
MGPGSLSEILGGLPKQFDANLLVGYDSSDDAAVYQVSPDVAVIQTTDFFPSMVKDPYIFGQISATNALSDVYSMGGKVITALNIVAYPDNSQSLENLAEILRGGAEKVLEAGGVLAGGHTIRQSTPLYGLAVAGIVHPDKIITNNGAKAGDAIIATKKLGVGIVTTAHNKGLIDEKAFDEAIESMTTLNKYAAEVMLDYQATACTDITGFGILGHLIEMCDDQLTAEIIADKIPIIEGAYQAAKENLTTGGAKRNRGHYAKDIDFQIKDAAMEEVLFDPQTSGGLLITVPEEKLEAILAAYKEKSIQAAHIGYMVDKKDKSIVVK